MVKVKGLTAEELEKLNKEHPQRNKGQWDEIIESVKKNKRAVQLTDITRGQAWSIKRKCKEAGLNCRVLNGGESVVIY
ncbi:MAG: hypothetical protein K6T73_08135, partial [Candidatus Bathyarchaeota archaeon]|nr:hypothetical protein [Candidatus Bathyarchaeota archaeon]